MARTVHDTHPVVSCVGPSLYMIGQSYRSLDFLARALMTHGGAFPRSVLALANTNQSGWQPRVHPVRGLASSIGGYTAFYGEPSPHLTQHTPGIRRCRGARSTLHQKNLAKARHRRIARRLVRTCWRSTTLRAASQTRPQAGPAEGTFHGPGFSAL